MDEKNQYSCKAESVTLFKLGLFFIEFTLRLKNFFWFFLQELYAKNTCTVAYINNVKRYNISNLSKLLYLTKYLELNIIGLQLTKTNKQKVKVCIIIEKMIKFF